MISLTAAQARRLAIVKQHLAGAPPKPTAQNIYSILRDLGCVQLDPISAVARSHQLVVFSRVGPYRAAELDKLLWRERKLFEYWAHCASIVLTEDYPIHSVMMRDYSSIVQPRFKPDPSQRSGFLNSDSAWTKSARAWIRDNDKLRRAILARLRREGALPARAFAEDGVGTRHWVSTGWTSGRNVSRMLDFLWLSGTIMVAGREGLQKTWDLSERVLPAWAPRQVLSAREVVLRSTVKSLKALGVATPKQIAFHFVRGRYPDLKEILRDLLAEGKIHRAEIVTEKRKPNGEWYIHADDVPMLDHLAGDAWELRTTLLSPFDNLIADRARTKFLFDFDYTIEIYTPKEKRRFGYYVLPILHGDSLIGRIDPVMDRANSRLVINAAYAEKSSPKTRAMGHVVENAIESLAQFLGAREIVYRRRLPTAWR